MTTPWIRWRDTPVADREGHVVELSAATRAEEARIVASVADELRSRGVPPREILVVARDLDPYETLFRRAAIREGLTPTFWTQLNLVATEPYRLCDGLCDSLGGEPISVETLLRPLKRGWVPPDDDVGAWPVDTRTIRRLTHEAPDGALSLSAWYERTVTSAWGEDRLARHVHWLSEQTRVPSATDVEDVLGRTLDRYRDVTLPRRKEEDGPPLLETERSARALNRTRELLEPLSATYDDWHATGRCEQSWTAVAAILKQYATQRPGRREHGNAHVIDVVEANDAWGRDVRYVVAAGLTDGVWPRRQDPYVPADLREAILAGRDGLGAVVPESRWSQLRAHDQFADAVAAASDAVVCTRHTEHEDDSVDRSPLLETIATESVSRGEAAGLLAADRCVPPALENVLPGSDDRPPESDR